MLYLADTNILLRLAEQKHPMHAEARGAINTLVAKGDAVCVIPQNIIEFWNVATRPALNNGLGFTTVQAQVEVEKIEKLFQVIPDVVGILAPLATGIIISRTGSYAPGFALAAIMLVAGLAAYWFIVGELKHSDYPTSIVGHHDKGLS